MKAWCLVPLPFGVFTNTLCLWVNFNLKFRRIISAGVVQIFKEKDESRKSELQKTFSSETLPNALKMFDKLFKANEGKYFVGRDVSAIPLLTFIPKIDDIFCLTVDLG